MRANAQVECVMVHTKELSPEKVIADTRYWVKSTVIHYNLCPFANQVFSSDRVCFDVSEATTEEKLLEDCLLAIQKNACCTQRAG